MARKQKASTPATQTEAPDVQPTLDYKFEIVGSEPIELKGMQAESLQNINNWLGGLGPNVLEVPVGSHLLLITRDKVAYIVVNQSAPVGVEPVPTEEA